MQVLDACAAPGNKTVHLAALMKGRGRVVAFEINENRVKRLRETVRLTGASSIQLHIYLRTWFFWCVSVLLGWRGYYNCLVSVFLNLGHRCDCTSAGLLSSRSISAWICKGKSPSLWACGKVSVREPNTLNFLSHATCHRFFVAHIHNNHTL